MKRLSAQRPLLPAASILFLLLIPAAAITGCSHHKKSTKVPQGKIILDVKPDHAHVYIDERLQGTASMFNKKPLLISQGKHRLKLQAEDYFSEYVEITVSKDTKKFEIVMKKVPPPIYP